MNIRLALPLIAVIASLSLPASAQKMYRCGSTYQQQPCGGGKEGKVIGHGTGTASPSVASPANLHPACAQRGAAAQKIKWIREAGNTQQQQEEEEAQQTAHDPKMPHSRRLCWWEHEVLAWIESNRPAEPPPVKRPRGRPTKVEQLARERWAQTAKVRRDAEGGSQ